jgi:hypothetical protein
MVLKYSHWLQHFRDFRGEVSGSPSLARSNLAVPNQGLRRGAFATRHKPLDPASPSNGSATIDLSRADEISSFQPLLLGSHDEIIMPVHGTSV